jgi:D-alanyl-D-alanine carboxypeptidase
MSPRFPRFFFITAIVVCAVSLVLAQRGNPLVQLDGQSPDQMIAAFMAERQIPGVTLAIVQAPYISRAAGYGVSDNATRRLASPKTLWNVGQMARAYTAVAIVQLAEAGKLKMDDPVGTHVSGLPSAWQQVTVSQLMAHASGLPDYTAQQGFDPSRKYTRAELLALVRGAPPVFRPGAQVAASATDFLLLGQVVEHASGMSYEAFVTKNQIERLHLKNTIFAKELPSVKQETLAAAGAKHKAFLAERPFIDPTEAATGYTMKAGTLAPVPAGADSAWFGHGAIFASAEDISLWDIGLAGGLLVTVKDNRDVLYNPTKIAGGTVVPAHAGWRFPKHAGLMDIEGSVPGSSCYLARFTAPTELLCVTLCGNRDGIDFTDLGRRIAGAFDPKLAPPKNAKTSRESTFPVPVTVDRLTAFLQSKGVQVSAKTSQATTELLVKSGRIVVWQEADGTVWAGYDDMADLTAHVQAAVKYATAPY